MILKPKKLQLGDMIGLVSPSSSTDDNLFEIEAGLSWLNALGFNLKLGKNFQSRANTSAGSVAQRAADLNELFGDPEVKAIFCSLGGDSASELLPRLDYDRIKKNPKIFIGFSDISHLLLAIYHKTGLITFHGPNVVTLPSLDNESKQWLTDLLTGKSLAGKNIFDKGEIIKGGKGSGKLIGGNLFVANSLVKTEFSPDYFGSIFFLEEISDETGSIQSHLEKLKNTGILKHLSGMVVGHLHNLNPAEGSVEKILLEITKDYNFPIIKVDNFGHKTKTFLTFPIGVKAEINTEKFSFTFLESFDQELLS